MKKLADMSAEELAGLICEALLKAGITTNLSGADVWQSGQRASTSRDLDFIEEGPVPRRKVKGVLAELGFVEKHSYFVHPDTEFFRVSDRAVDRWRRTGRKERNQSLSSSENPRVGGSIPPLTTKHSKPMKGAFTLEGRHHYRSGIPASRSTSADSSITVLSK